MDFLFFSGLSLAEFDNKAFPHFILTKLKFNDMCIYSYKFLAKTMMTTSIKVKFKIKRKDKRTLTIEECQT